MAGCVILMRVNRSATYMFFSAFFRYLLVGLTAALSIGTSALVHAQSTVVAPPPAVNSEAYVNLGNPVSGECLVQQSQSFYEWRCAGQVLPPEGQKYALTNGVIVGQRSVIVIDSGATALVGEALANDVREAFPDLRLYVLNTQPKPEHVLGNIGFFRAYSDQFRSVAGLEGRIIASPQTKELMQARCPDCIVNFAERMGSQAVIGTETVIPGFVLSRRQADFSMIDPSLKHWIYSMYERLDAEENVLLFSAEENAFWVGSAVQKTMVPDLYEGSVLQRLEYLGELNRVVASNSVVLSSFGRLDPLWIRRNLNYYSHLQQSILLEMETGTTEVEMINKLTQAYAMAVPNLSQPELMTHQFNIQRIYRETEEFMLR